MPIKTSLKFYFSLLLVLDYCHCNERNSNIPEMEEIGSLKGFNGAQLVTVLDVGLTSNNGLKCVTDSICIYIYKPK